MSAVIVLILRIVLAASLYAFLGWALLTLWRDLRASSLLVSNRQTPPLFIAIVDGAGQAARKFSSPDILIGRDQASSLIIPDEMVSAQHAKLSYHHNQWWVEDLQSTNGTFLNDERVFTPTVLIDGDEIRCGKASLIVSFSEPAPSNPAP